MKGLTLNWGGKSYTVPEGQMFELIEAVERHVTLPELLSMIGSGRPNFAAMARPFHAMLTFAGVRDVPPMIELRRMLVAEGMRNAAAMAKGGAAPVAGPAMTAIGAMCELLMDGADVSNIQPEAGDGKKTRPHSRKAVIKSR
jgi:hypothetical protein